MSETRRKYRFSQEDDRDPTHDDLFLELLATWKERLPELPGFPERGVLGECRIVGEAILRAPRGGPLMFPDAIAYGTLCVDHRSVPVTYTEKGLSQSEYACSVKGCHSAPVKTEPFQFGEPEPNRWGAEADWKAWEERKSEAERIHKESERRRAAAGLYWKELCPWGSFRVDFEVKPVVRSFGEVLRQLRLYREGTDGGSAKWRVTCLFTPDTRFDAEFFDQGFAVMHPRRRAGSAVPAPSLDAFTEGEPSK
jgi:hypothetical protein